MKKLSSTAAKFKKGVAHKKVCNSLIINVVIEMHFLFHCFKSAPRAFNFVEIFYFVKILSKDG